MSSEPDVICPFCKEGGFDLMGLKHHFNSGYCAKYNDTTPLCGHCGHDCHCESECSQHENGCGCMGCTH